MHKILIFSLLFVLLASSAEAEDDWSQAVIINGKQTPVIYENGRLYSATYQKLDGKNGVVGYFLNYDCQHNTLSFSFVYPGENKQLLNSEAFGIGFDNNPPQYFSGYLLPGIPNWISFGRNHPAVEKVKVHKNMWVLFAIREYTLGTGWQGYVSYKVKFDLTGFSRELAKCSGIPDTN